MKKIAVVVLGLSSSLSFAVGCPPSGEGEGEGDAGEGEGEEGEGDVGEGEGEAPPIDNPFGFEMRAPSSHALPCDDPDFCPTGTFDAIDQDYVCTFTQDGHDAVIYARATPTSVSTAGFPLPVYEATVFIAENDVVTAADAPGYDIGGNHHNDTFSFAVDGVRYTYDHSSFGFGFRVCQPPDCVKREEGANFVDGCNNPERSLPEACIAVASPLPPLVDNFATCLGDPDAP